jgi:hypothetical protein
MSARPERVPAEEVRRRMLDAGRDLAQEAGAALTIEHLRLEEVIQRARVPRSSAYRMWPYREDYIDDLLSYLAGPGSWFSDRTVADPETLTIALRVLEENPERLRTPEGRRALMCEAVRVTVTRNYESLTASTPWRLHMALVATLGSTQSGAARRRIARALEEGQTLNRESLVAVLGFLAREVGLRLRDPAYSFEHVQLAAGLMVQSLALRNVQVQAALASPEDDVAGTGTGPADASVPDGPPSAPDFVNGLLNVPIPGPARHGGHTEWNLAAFAFLGVIDAFMELDPDFRPPEAG